MAAATLPNVPSRPSAHGPPDHTKMTDHPGARGCGVPFWHANPCFHRRRRRRRLGLALVVLPALPAAAKGLSNSQIQAAREEAQPGEEADVLGDVRLVTDGSSRHHLPAAGKSNFTLRGRQQRDQHGQEDLLLLEELGQQRQLGEQWEHRELGEQRELRLDDHDHQGRGLQCITESGANPLAGLVNLFSPALLLNVLNEDKVVGRGTCPRHQCHDVDAEVRRSELRPASRPPCTDRTGKYCVTNQGLLAYVGGTGGSTFKMTKYSCNPSPSLFKLPANATTVTIPSVPDISIPDVSVP